MRTLLLSLLLVVVGCDGTTGDELGPDGGNPCLVPTVAPLASPGGDGSASALLDVDLGELASGPDPVELASVHILPVPGGESLLGIVEAVELSVQPSSGRSVRLLAARGPAGDDTPVLSLLGDGPLDLRRLAPGGRLPLRLEITGKLPQGPWSVTVEVCVTTVTPRGRL
jgi:hypothetical protein